MTLSILVKTVLTLSRRVFARLSRNKTLLVLLLSFLSSVVVYRHYFFSGRVPFSSNLLVSFYAPWDSDVIPGWEQGIPNKPLGHDGLRFFFPIKKNIVESVSNGTLPLWNPYVFSGSPLFANMQSSLLYPTTLLYFVIPLIDAWSLQIVLTPVLNMVLMYLYMRKIGLKFTTSILTGLLWAYSGFYAVWGQENPAVVQSALWLPFILYFLERFIASRKSYELIIAAFGMTLSILGGHLQFSLYIFVFSIVYFFARAQISLKKRILSLSIFSIISVSLAAIQLLSSFEVFLHSPRTFERSQYFFDIYLKPITHLVNMVAPDWKGNPATYNYFDQGSYYDQILYIGLIPLMLAIFGYTLNRKNRVVQLYVLSVLITLLLGFDNYISNFIFNLNVPFFSSVIPSRIFFLTSFSFLVLSGFGVEKIQEKNISRTTLFRALLFPLILLLAGWIYFFLYSEEGIIASKTLYPLTMMKNLLLPSLIYLASVLLFLIAAQAKRFKKVGFLLLIAMIVFHQFYFYSKNVYFSERIFVFPQHSLFTYLSKLSQNGGRFVGLGQAGIKPNVASYFNLYSPEGLDPMLPGEYATLAWKAQSKQAGRNINPLIEVSFSELFPAKTVITGSEPIVEFMRAAGVRYLVTHDSDEYVMHSGNFIPIQSLTPFTVWELQNSARVFLTSSYTLSSHVVKEIGQIVLDDVPAIKPEECGIREIKSASYQMSRVLFTTKSECTTLLYLADTYYPGWVATVDGAETRIYRANGAFRAIVLPKGDHQVVFEYMPSSVRIGFYVSLVALIGVIIVVRSHNVKKILG